MALGICERCKRHARGACPFCGGRVIEPVRGPAMRLSRAALVLLTACGGAQQGPAALYGGPPPEPAADAAAPTPDPNPTVQPAYGAPALQK